jgi:hypothetical protein
MSKIESLTVNQRRAIRGLMVKQNIATAALYSKVGESTLYRWLGDSDFRGALVEAEAAALDNATRRLVTLSDAAISVVTQLMLDRAAPPAVRLRAAEVALNHMLHLTNLRNIEARIRALEEADNA